MVTHTAVIAFTMPPFGRIDFDVNLETGVTKEFISSMMVCILRFAESSVGEIPDDALHYIEQQTNESFARIEEWQNRIGIQKGRWQVCLMADREIRRVTVGIIQPMKAVKIKINFPGKEGNDHA